jgi:NADH dehydrogenase FAD-containing subunit
MFRIESFAVPSFMKFKDWFNSDTKYEKKNVYLLGQGWFAKGFLEYIDKSKYTVTNVYRNQFVNTPMLLQTIKSDTKLNTSITKFVANADRCILDTVESIDLPRKHFSTVSGNKYSWEGGYLVCGLGSNTDVGKFWTEKISYLKNIKPKSNLCIVGAGPTGTELGFHLTDLGHKITLYDGMDIDKLYTFLTPDGKLKILNSLKDKSIELVPSKMFGLEDKPKFDDVIFAVGSRPNDLVSKWEVTPKLNLLGYSDVFIGGDCIGIQQNNDQLVKSYPKTAQVAYQQGMYVAKRLNNLKETNEDFVYVPKGIALYKGSNSYYVEIDDLKLTIPKIFVEVYYSWFK